MVSCIILREESILASKNLTHETAQFFIARRALHASNGGFWELPGGKLEPNETEIVGLQRELFEELGTSFDISQFMSKEPIFEYCHIVNNNKESLQKEINLCYYLLYATENNEKLFKLDKNELIEWRWVTTNDTNEWIQQTYENNIQDTPASTQTSANNMNLYNFISPGDIPVLEWLDKNKFWEI